MPSKKIYRRQTGIRKDAQHHLFIRKVKIKTTMRYCYVCIRIPLKKIDNTKCQPGEGVTGTLICCWWEYKMVQPIWETVWWFLIKLNIRSLHNHKSVVLGIYPRQKKTYDPQNLHENAMAALFIITNKLETMQMCIN